MEEGNQHTDNIWEGYVDWKNRPAMKTRHGGLLAASFILVVEVLENLAYLANASNLVIYLSQYMNFSPSDSANTVTNFMGTAFLLALVGGFLSDALCTTYYIYLFSAAVELLGLVILTLQANSSSLQTGSCDEATSTSPCHHITSKQAAIFFTGLYLVALGVGGIKGSLPAHGAEQFDDSTVKGRHQRSTFFNYFVFALSCGALVAVTLVVWIEDNVGWKWGFGISTLTILLSIPVFLAGSALYRNKVPSGSPFTSILKVLVAACLNSCMPRSSSTAIANISGSPSSPSRASNQTDDKPKIFHTNITPTSSLKFLNTAVTNKPFFSTLECSTEELEDVKVVVKIFPIFACTIMLNSCLAQLSTFSVHQAATMDRKLGPLNVPPASLPVFPVVFIMALAPVYDHLILPAARKVTKTEMGITHLQRIGIGLVLSIFAMAVAAAVEIKRHNVASTSGLLDSSEPLPITFFWIALQYLFLGSADLFTLAGLLEFFFTEAPANMRSLATSLSWASLAVGYYLSSVIVSIVNSVTGNAAHQPWLSGSNLNQYRLENFYWLMCGLSFINFLHYLFWAKWYKYRSTNASIPK
uniref:Uncharacterized protein n=1 Tax=Kalanchoe fedtschenkoi TaxID=63787 RepID=A0A7N0V5E9_KALFE